MEIYTQMQDYRSQKFVSLPQCQCKANGQNVILYDWVVIFQPGRL